MPPVIGAPLPRVSTIRQGASPMNGSGFVTSPIVVSAPWDLAGLQVAGADQLGMIWPPRAKPARKTRIEPRNEALRISTEHLLIECRDRETTAGESVGRRRR